MIVESPFMDAPAALLVFVSVFARGEKGAIRAFHVDPETGRVTAAHETRNVSHAFFLALSSDMKTLYSIESETFGGDDTADEDVVAWRIVDRDGRLERLGHQSCKGTISCYLEADPSGRSLLVANYGTGSVAAFPIKADGSLGAAVGFVKHAGSSVNPERQQKPCAHSIIPAPAPKTGRPQFVYAADLGTDEIVGYVLAPAQATLVRNDAGTVKAAPGSGPRHLRFHPAGHTLYVLNELIGGVTAYGYDADTGRLTPRQTVPTLPADFTGDNLSADLQITPDGRFLYATNRGHDTIAMYAVDEATGKLTFLGVEPIQGAMPRNFAVDPSGTCLLTGGQNSNTVSVFRIDQTTGRLAFTGTRIDVPAPVSIVFNRL